MSRVRVSAVSDVGCVRTANQDEFLVARFSQGKIALETAEDCFPGEGLILAVADGMGGMPDGDVASRIAVEAVAHGASQIAAGPPLPNGELRALVQGIFEEAHHRIVVANQGRQPHRMMGTTLALVALDGTRGVLGHVGDSRIYLFRDRRVHPLTTDQTVANYLMRFGHISPEEARVHPERKVLAQALGHGAEIEVQVDVLDLEEGDVLLACSDGLTDLLEDEELGNLVLAGSGDLAATAQRLVDSAKNLGGHDNITLILAGYEDESDLEDTQVIPIPH